MFQNKYVFYDLFKLHSYIEIVFGGLNNEREFADRKRIYE